MLEPLFRPKRLLLVGLSDKPGNLGKNIVANLADFRFDGELFLLSATNPASFDSRYFGPVAVSAVIGSAQPLWTWGTP